MEEYKIIFDQINIKHDLVSSIMLSGIFIDLLISLVLFTNRQTKSTTLHLFNAFILIIAFINLDFYLCYTGLIKCVPRLFNSNEFSYSY